MKIFPKLVFTLSALLFLLLPVSQVLAVGATLSLSPSSGTFNQGCSFSLTVNLDTGGSQTDGTDIVLFYDPARFTVTGLTPGSIYQDFPTSDFSTSGTVKFSGLAAVGSTFSGSGVLVTINFNVLANAPTDSASQIKFDFDPNNKSRTTGTVVAEHGTVAQILNQVVNGSYNIGTNACGISPTPTPTGIFSPPVNSSPSGNPVGIGGPTLSSPTPTRSPLPNSGSEGQTIALALTGSSLLLLGILGLAIL